MTDHKNKPHQQPQQGNKQNSKDPVREADFKEHQPDKKTQIDDNPDETKKKIPNMQKKH
jgi:hypothetical protein